MTRTRNDTAHVDPQTLQLTITRTFRAPQELVWQAWTQSEHLMQWYAGENCRPTFAEMDLRVGGKWRSGMMWASEQRELIHHGTFREIDAPNRLVFTHAWQEEDPASACQSTIESVVSVTLQACEEGTRMTFEQTGFASVASRDSHHGGWSDAFDSLATQLEDPTAADASAIIISRVFHAPRKLVWEACTQAEHISHWWGPHGFQTRVEALEFHVGGRMHYVMTGPDGAEYPSIGNFQEIIPLERYVVTERFGEGFKHPTIEDFPELIVMVTSFEDVSEHTRMTVRIRHQNDAERRRHEEMGLIMGFASTLDRLAGFLADRQSRQRVSNTLMLALPDETRIAVVRTFDAPRQMVFDAYTKPEQLRKWFFGPADWPLVECTVDLRVGGTFRSVWRHGDGKTCGVRGVFREVDPPHRFVHTESFDEDWTGGPTVVTTTFEEYDGRTTVSSIVQYASREARDGVLNTDMLEGWGQMMDRLDPMLSEHAPNGH